MITVKEVREDLEKAPKFLIYKKDPYVILGKENNVLWSGDLEDFKNGIVISSGYYDQCEIQARQNDIYLADNTRMCEVPRSHGYRTDGSKFGKPKLVERITCKWFRVDEDEYGNVYNSECGFDFTFSDERDGLTEHNFTYCPKCSKRIVETNQKDNQCTTH